MLGTTFRCLFMKYQDFDSCSGVIDAVHALSARHNSVKPEEKGFPRSLDADEQEEMAEVRTLGARSGPEGFFSRQQYIELVRAHDIPSPISKISYLLDMFAISSLLFASGALASPILLES